MLHSAPPSETVQLLALRGSEELPRLASYPLLLRVDNSMSQLPRLAENLLVMRNNVQPPVGDGFHLCADGNVLPARLMPIRRQKRCCQSSGPCNDGNAGSQTMRVQWSTKRVDDEGRWRPVRGGDHSAVDKTR